MCAIKALISLLLGVNFAGTRIQRQYNSTVALNQIHKTQDDGCGTPARTYASETAVPAQCTAAYRRSSGAVQPALDSFRILLLPPSSSSIIIILLLLLLSSSFRRVSSHPRSGARHTAARARRHTLPPFPPLPPSLSPPGVSFSFSLPTSSFYFIKILKNK